MTTGAAALASVVRGLAAGVEPVRLLGEALGGAVLDTGGHQGMVAGLVEGVAVQLAATGTMPSVVRAAAEEALATGRTVRKRQTGTGAGAVAHPIRAGARLVGAIAIGGDPGVLRPEALTTWADLTALVVGRFPTPATGLPAAAQMLDALADIASDLDHAGVVNRTFAAARTLFGAQGGLYMLVDGDRARIAHVENLDLEALRTVAVTPAFRHFVACPVLQVAEPGHPAVARLVRGAESAVALPLETAGRRLGHLLVVFGQPPAAAVQALLARFASQVAALLRASELAREVTEGDTRLAGVAHTLPHPVVVLDDADRFVLVNGAAAELFHLPSAYARGQQVAGKLGDAALEAMVQSDGDGQLEVLLGTPESHLYRATARRVLSPAGAVLAKVLVLEDVTVVRETARIKDDFVAVIGHELRTPLTIVKGYVHMLQRKGGDIEERARETALAALQANTSRLERLIEDLLFVSAVETTTTVDLAPTDLSALLDAKGGERVVVRRPRMPVVVPVDPAKLDQVLHHLLDNALKYADGEVVLELSDRGEEVELAVEDHGPGIFSGDLPLLFERFRQLDGTNTRTHGGTGLGLYVCRRLVELLGGRIWCESRLGVGSRFAFTLPKDGAGAVATRAQGGTRLSA